MSLSASLVAIALLIVASAFLSMAEMSLAASRRLRLRQMADEGDARAARALAVQEQPGHYFTVVQIGLNMIAILGGIVGEGAFTPAFTAFFAHGMPAEAAAKVGFLCSFIVVTALFVVLADLIPKRVGMVEPERVAIRVVGPMLWLARLLMPLVWLLNGVSNGLIRVFGLPAEREERVTAADILALTEAGAQSGAVANAEQQVIENVFELETRTVESAMTPRDRIVYLLLDDEDALIRSRVAERPHSTYPVCDGGIDRVAGYVDAADLFQRVLNGRPLALQGETAAGLLHKVLIVPDRLTLAEMLTQFRQAREDFAVIVNEYSLVVGVITLNDVMSTVMASMVVPEDEELIVRRDDGSYLADGVTPIPDLQRALGIEIWPQAGQYDTLAGFLMVMLRRIPRRTDGTEWEGWRFEVMDVDSHRVDQVMITRVDARADPQSAA
ncbi:MAG: HlyC/CorC family transporter [Rubrivivax sp.]|nr:HlyC/CorC family transporter [Rubrivivax sp.]